MKKTATLIATLMLGVASCAYAQGGPGEALGGAGGGARGPAGIGPGGGGEGPGAGGPIGGDGPGVPGSPGGGEGRAGDGPGPAAREGRSAGGAEAPSPSRSAKSPARQGGERQKSAGDANESRGDKPDGDTKASRGDRDSGGEGKKSESAAEKAAEGVKSDAKSATKGADTGVRDKADDASKRAQDAADKKVVDPQRAEKAERAKQVDLSGDKRQRLQGAFRDKGDVKRRTNVDIDISIGRRLPRDWHFVPVPITVIEIVPEYRDYVFVYVEDEYVICDPYTYEVVAVIPAGGGRTYAGGGSADRECSTRIRLSEDQRELILQSVRLGREVDVSDLEVGWSVPQDIELEKFPNAVLSEASELAACRYFIADDQLAIVDPDDDKVVLLIDKS